MSSIAVLPSRQTADILPTALAGPMDQGASLGSARPRSNSTPNHFPVSPTCAHRCFPQTAVGLGSSRIRYLKKYINERGPPDPRVLGGRRTAWRKLGRRQYDSVRHVRSAHRSVARVRGRGRADGVDDARRGAARSRPCFSVNAAGQPRRVVHGDQGRPGRKLGCGGPRPQDWPA